MRYHKTSPRLPRLPRLLHGRAALSGFVAWDFEPQGVLTKIYPRRRHVIEDYIFIDEDAVRDDEVFLQIQVVFGGERPPSFGLRHLILRPVLRPLSFHLALRLLTPQVLKVL